MRVGPCDRISVLMKRDRLEPSFCPMKTVRRWPSTNQEDSPEVKWKSLSHVWLCNPMDCIVHGTLQARKLEWVAYPFSSRSSHPRNQTRVCCIAGRFFTNWAIREAWRELYQELNLSTSWSYTSNLENWEKINFGHLYYPVYSIGLARSSSGFFRKMLQKPEQTFLANPIFVMAAQANLDREQWFL